MNNFWKLVIKEDDSNQVEASKSDNKPGIISKTGTKIHDSMGKLGNSIGSALKNNFHATGYGLTGSALLGLGVGTAALIRHFRKKNKNKLNANK